MNLRQMIEKYKDVIPYMFFGVCTTLVNVITYWVVAHGLNISVMPSTIIAWLFAVVFAYVTNRKWVFHSQAHGCKEIVREMISFFTCRIMTGIVDWICMFIFVDILHWNDVLIKFVANIIVIVLNYLASKIVIFKKK